MTKPTQLTDNDASPYLAFNRQQWCRFRQDAPLTLTESDLQSLTGVNEVVSLSEVKDIYLPLSRLVSLYVKATQTLHQASGEFLGASVPKVPYIIGVAGSVAVGKSTTSRILQALLSQPGHPNVSLVTTDGFLYPNAELERRGIMNRKGFPESYDLPQLLSFLYALKAGKGSVRAPIYSHHQYNIVPNEFINIEHPDIVIIEGLNILQTGVIGQGRNPQVFVSDFFDFTVFVDAEIAAIKQWFIDRVLTFCRGAFQDPQAYFHQLSKLNDEETIKFAERVWREINEVNLLENILPFRERARLILCKHSDHSVQKVLLRKL